MEGTIPGPTLTVSKALGLTRRVSEQGSIRSVIIKINRCRRQDEHKFCSWNNSETESLFGILSLVRAVSGASVCYCCKVLRLHACSHFGKVDYEFRDLEGVYALRRQRTLVLFDNVSFVYQPRVRKWCRSGSFIIAFSRGIKRLTNVGKSLFFSLKSLDFVLLTSIT